MARCGPIDPEADSNSTSAENVSNFLEACITFVRWPAPSPPSQHETGGEAMASGRSGEMTPDLPGNIISVTSPPVAHPPTELPKKNNDPTDG